MDIRRAIDMIVAGADPRSLLESGGTLTAHYYSQREPAVEEAPSPPLPSDPEPRATNEVAPPGWSGTVKAMKTHSDIDNPFALAWSMKKKGFKPHKKPEKSETILDFSYEDYVEQYLTDVKDERLGEVAVGPMLAETGFQTLLRILNTLERTQRRPDLALKFKRKLLCPV